MANWRLNYLVILAAFIAAFIDCAPTDKLVDFETLIKPNTPENLQRLKNLGKDELAEELSGQYQGDIVLSPEEIRELEQPGRNGRTGMINERYLWDDNLIPYRIQEEDFTEEQIAYIHEGTKKLSEVSCLIFVAYNPDVHYDYITVRGTGSGCSSSVGRRGGQQYINLEPYDIETGCFRLYTIVHEFLHATGFYHMQSAYDRDEYVKIVTENIQPGTGSNFNLYSSEVITHYNVEYDYGSVMHYSRLAFSVNGEDTIVPLRDLNGETMGQRERISVKDIHRLNRRYCIEPTDTPITNPTPTSEPITIEPTTTPSTMPSTTTTSLTTMPQTTTSRPPIRPPMPNIPGIVQSVNGFVNNLLSNIFASIRWR